MEEMTTKLARNGCSIKSVDTGRVINQQMRFR